MRCLYCERQYELHESACLVVIHAHGEMDFEVYGERVAQGAQLVWCNLDCLFKWVVLQMLKEGQDEIRDP